MNEFIAFDYVMSYAGMVATVMLLTQVFKSVLDKFLHNKTKFLVLGLSVALCIFGAIYYGDFSSSLETAKTILVWLINAAMVWLASMKSYELTKKEIK